MDQHIIKVLRNGDRVYVEPYGKGTVFTRLSGNMMAQLDEVQESGETEIYLNESMKIRFLQLPESAIQQRHRDHGMVRQDFQTGQHPVFGWLE